MLESLCEDLKVGMVIFGLVAVSFFRVRCSKPMQRYLEVNCNVATAPDEDVHSISSVTFSAVAADQAFWLDERAGVLTTCSGVEVCDSGHLCSNYSRTTEEESSSQRFPLAHWDTFRWIVKKKSIKLLLAMQPRPLPEWPGWARLSCHSAKLWLTGISGQSQVWYQGASAVETTEPSESP